MKNFLPFFLFPLTATFAQLPEQHGTIKTFCRTDEYTEQLNKQYNPLNIQHPEETFSKELLQNSGSYRQGERVIYVIPIVFHIVHAGGNENIPDANIYDAIRILNEDYNKLNPDTTNIVAAFKPIAANVGFEFRLAQKDALGNCVKGITRTYSLETFVGTQAMVDDVNRNLNGNPSNTNNVRFPRNKYLNVWVCADPNGAAGYTNLPSGFVPAKYDGIWLKYNYCGSLPPSNATTSRALTHEVGHWMNLRHTWGNSNNPGLSSNCNEDDNVTDTPNTIGWTTCNLTGTSCSSLDNVQNYMEYSYCSNMFTEGQKTRMINAINSGTAQRNQLWQSQNLIDAGVAGPDILCAADFSANRITICEGQTVNFTDESYHGVTTWNWTFTGGSPATSTLQNPQITYNTPGTYSVSLTAGNGSQNVSVTKNQYITVLPASGTPAPIMEGFETVNTLPDNNWFIDNADGLGTWTVANIGYTGNKSVKIDNFISPSLSPDAFISNTYDLSALSAAQVAFKYAYAHKVATVPSSVRLRVMASFNCGQTWSTIRNISGSQLSTVNNTPVTNAFTPANQNDWKEIVVNLTGIYLVPGFMIKFEFTGNADCNNIYVDDINISAPTSAEYNTIFNGITVYPNPADEEMNITFNLLQNTQISIKLYDQLGKEVMDLASGSYSQGQHNIVIDNNNLSNGIYHLRIQAGEINITRKIVFK